MGWQDAPVVSQGSGGQESWKSAPVVKPAPSTWDDVKDVASNVWDWAKNLGTAAYKGIADLPAGAADANAGSYDVTDAALAFTGNKPRELSAPDAVTAALDKTGYQPKTKAQQVGANIVRAGFGAATNPMNLVVGPEVEGAKAVLKQVAKNTAKNIAIGTGSGVGGEVAGAVTDIPYARLAGSVAGGLVTGGGMALYNPRNTTSLAKKALSNVDPKDLATAKQNMLDALERGVPINLSQAMPQSSNIDSIVDTLANNSFGKRTTEQLRNQPNQIAFGLEQKLAELPGEVAPSMQQPANSVNQAATAVVDTAKKERTNAFQRTLADVQSQQQAEADAALQAAKSQEQAMAERASIAQALEKAKQPPAPATAIPTGVGATKDGILLNDAGRGEVALNSVATTDGQNTLNAGKSAILGADGKPLVTPPVPGDVGAFGADLAAARHGVQTAQAAADSVGSVPPKAVQGAYGKLTATASQFPNTGLGDMLVELRDKLKQGGQWITNADQLNEILKEAGNKLKSPDLATKGIDAGRADYMRKVIGGIRNDLGDAFEPFKQANAAYIDATENIVNPVKQSVVGRLATARGAKPDAEAAITKLQSLFDRGTNPGAQKSEILELADQLKKVDPAVAGVDGKQAFQDSVKTWFANKLSAVQEPVNNRVPDSIARRFVSLFGNGQQPTPQSQGLKDMLAGVARTQGMPESTYVKGMENFSKIIGMAANRPATVRGVSEAALDAVASGNPLSVGNRTRTGIVGNIAARLNEALRGDAYREMDRLLTSPEGVDMLKKLAAGSPTDPKLQAIVSTFLGTHGELQGDNYGK